MQNPAAARQAFDTARAAYLARDFAAAEAACRGALAFAPGESRIHLLLGEVLLGAGRRAEALAAYARAAELFPGLGLPFTRLATLRLRQRYAPVPPRRADPTRARLQMTTLGRRGRFGNQLLQYAYARSYADRHALELEVIFDGFGSRWGWFSLAGLAPTPHASGGMEREKGEQTGGFHDIQLRARRGGRAFRVSMAMFTSSASGGIQK